MSIYLQHSFVCLHSATAYHPSRETIALVVSGMDDRTAAGGASGEETAHIRHSEPTYLLWLNCRVGQGRDKTKNIRRKTQRIFFNYIILDNFFKTRFSAIEVLSFKSTSALYFCLIC